MPGMGGAGRTGSTASVRGMVAGAVLRAVRTSLGHTQERLAERFGVSVETVQSWETGRRALVGSSFAELQRVRRELAAAGARPALLAVWDRALTADSILAAVDAGDLTAHPLAYLVPDRTLSELVAWPISGAPPRQLDGHLVQLRVPADVRDHLAANLRRAAELAADEERSAMLRRQARFFVAGHPGSRQWIADADAGDRRRPADLRDWSPEWPVARSRAVSAALAGDPEPLERFVRDGLKTDRGMDANLRYWAYWVGEIPATWSADSDMLSAQPYTGELLMDSLIRGLETAPYRELCAYTVWALLRRRPRLADEPALTRRLSAAIDTVTSTAGAVSTDAVRRLNQVTYLIGR